MAGTFGGRNKRAIAAAKKNNFKTFQKEVVDYWPACVECGVTLRTRGLTGAQRACGCSGKIWICNSSGWAVK